MIEGARANRKEQIKSGLNGKEIGAEDEQRANNSTQKETVQVHSKEIHNLKPGQAPWVLTMQNKASYG